MQIKNDSINVHMMQSLRDSVGSSKVQKLPSKIESPKTSQPAEETKGLPFNEFLEQKINTQEPLAPELKFSAHAKSRLTSRGIELSSDEILRMQDAIQRAGAKGSKESLILTDKAAFIVSVKNNTVITAVDRDSLKENLFTNIDSTIMI